MKKLSYQWIDVETIYSTESEPQYSQEQMGRESFSTVASRVMLSKYEQAEVEVNLFPADPIQRVKTLIYRGHLEEARNILIDLEGATPQDHAEVLSELARLAIQERDWRTCLEYLDRALQLLPHGITRLTLLQMRALAHCESGAIVLAQRDLQSLEGLQTLYPLSPVNNYVHSLRVRTYVRQKLFSEARKSLHRFWCHLSQNPKVNLDGLQAFFRAVIDFELHAPQSNLGSKVDIGRIAICALGLAEIQGDRLYAALARLDIRKLGWTYDGLEQEIHRASQEFKRVRSEIQSRLQLPKTGGQVDGEDIFKAIGFSITEVQELDFIYFFKQKILIRIKDRMMFNLEKSKTTHRFLAELINNTNSSYKVDRGATEGGAEACSLQAAQGDRPSNEGLRSKWNWYKSLEKSEVFKRVWGIGRYVPHLHENLIDKTCSRLRKSYGVCVEVEDGVLSLKRSLIVNLEV